MCRGGEPVLLALMVKFSGGVWLAELLASAPEPPYPSSSLVLARRERE